MTWPEAQLARRGGCSLRARLRQQVTLELESQLAQLIHLHHGRVDSSDDQEVSVRRELHARARGRKVKLLSARRRAQLSATASSGEPVPPRLDELRAAAEVLILAQRLALLLAQPDWQALAARDVVHLAGGVKTAR